MTDRRQGGSCCERYGRPFSAWDLRLYLDTHPTDAQAIAQFVQLCESYEGGCYACRGLHPCDWEDGIWHYLDGPWPWEPQANCKTNAGDCARGGR